MLKEFNVWKVALSEKVIGYPFKLSAKTRVKIGKSIDGAVKICQLIAMSKEKSQTVQSYLNESIIRAGIAIFKQRENITL